MEYQDTRTLVSTGWLSRHLEDPDLRILDGSWHLPDTGRDGRAEYEQEHIPGARFFDINEIADTECGLPHMAPSPEKFMSRMREMGIGDGHQVVVYDGAGIFSRRGSGGCFDTWAISTWRCSMADCPAGSGEGHPVDDMPPALGPASHDGPAAGSPGYRCRPCRPSIAIGRCADPRRQPAARFRGDAPGAATGPRAGSHPGLGQLAIRRAAQ